MIEIEIIKMIGEMLKEKEKTKSDLNKRWLKNWITEREYIRQLSHCKGCIWALKEVLEHL